MSKVDGDRGSLGSGLCIPEMDALVASGVFLGWLDYENRMTSAVASRRSEALARLDAASNFVVVDGQLGFRQSFETIEDTETFSLAPTEVIDAARRLLTIDVAHGLSGIVHDTIVVEIGCSRVTFVLCATPLDVFWPVTFSSTHVQPLSLMIDINSSLDQSASMKDSRKSWRFRSLQSVLLSLGNPPIKRHATPPRILQ